MIVVGYSFPDQQFVLRNNLFQLVLGSVSKSTKVFLSRIGAFTVSAFHAYVYARSFSPGTSTSIVAPSASSHPQSTFKTETLNTAIGPRMQSSRMLSLPPKYAKTNFFSGIIVIVASLLGHAISATFRVEFVIYSCLVGGVEGGLVLILQLWQAHLL